MCEPAGGAGAAGDKTVALSCESRGRGGEVAAVRRNILGLSALGLY